MTGEEKSGRVVADFTKLAKSASFAAPGAATFAAGCAAGATASPPEMRTMSSIDNTRIRFGITDADSWWKAHHKRWGAELVYHRLGGTSMPNKRLLPRLVPAIVVLALPLIVVGQGQEAWDARLRSSIDANQIRETMRRMT